MRTESFGLRTFDIAIIVLLHFFVFNWRGHLLQNIRILIENIVHVLHSFELWIWSGVCALRIGTKLFEVRLEFLLIFDHWLLITNTHVRLIESWFKLTIFKRHFLVLFVVVMVRSHFRLETKKLFKILTSFFSDFGSRILKLNQIWSKAGASLRESALFDNIELRLSVLISHYLLILFILHIPGLISG